MSRLLPATLAVAALLLGAIVWELQDVAGPDHGTPAERSSAVPVARAALETEPGDVLQGWVATALERPLFRTDRRPPKGAEGFRCKTAEQACASLTHRATFMPRALHSRLRAQLDLEHQDVVARTAPCGCGALARRRRL